MFNILAMLNRAEFEEAKCLIRNKMGYEFSTMSYSNSAIVHKSPLVNMYIRTTSENHPVDTAFHGFRGDLVFINREIVSEELLRSIFIPCCEEGIQGIRDSSQFIDKLARSTIIDVLCIAEQEHFDHLEEKLKSACYNTQNKLLIHRNEELAFYGNFIKIRAIRRRNDHYRNLRGYKADIVFVERRDFHDFEARHMILRSCTTGKYGIRFL